MRRLLLHPASLVVIVVAFFAAGAGLGDQLGGKTATVTDRVTLRTTLEGSAPLVTVTVTAGPTTGSSATSSAVTIRLGRWHGRFRATALSLHTDTAGADHIFGRLRNTHACPDADVSLDATFYRKGVIVGTGSAPSTSVPRGARVPFDVIGFPTAAPDRATVAITGVRCG
jgi:hypothetical protein